MAETKSDTPAPPVEAVTLPPEAETERPLGAILVEARERRGLTREDVVRETHLPAHYLKMIETDNFGGIADQLYVLPFLRRYATFLEMDAEEVASRFVRDVQRAEVSVQRINDPIRMVTRQGRGPWIKFLYGVLIVLILALAADLAIRRFGIPRSPFGEASPVAQPLPSSFVTSIAPAPEPSENPAIPAAPQPAGAPAPPQSN